MKFETDKIKQENAALIRKNEWLSRRIEELKQSREAHLKKYQQAATVFKKELAKKVRMFQEELEKYRQKLVVADKERNETRTQIELMGGDRVHLVTELQQLTASQAVELKELREVVKLDKAKHLLYQRLQRQTKIWDEKEADYKRLLSEAKVFTAPDGSGSLVEARAAQLKLQEQISKLTNDLNELKTIMNSDAPLKAVMDSKKQLEEELVDQNELSEALMTELDEIAKSLSELQDKNAAFLVQTAEREKKNAKLVSERVKAAHVQSMLRQKNELLGVKLGVQGQAYQSQTRMLKRLEHQATSLKDQLAKSEENNASMQQQLTELKNTEQLNMHMAIDYRGQLEESSQRLEQVQLDLAKQNKSNAALERENRDLREQTVALKRKQRSDVGHGDIEGLEAELSLLKARLRCSVCSHRDQNVIITKCCHTFCRECINENLKVRLRKCPGCGVKFGEDDVKPIFI